MSLLQRIAHLERKVAPPVCPVQWIFVHCPDDDPEDPPPADLQAVERALTAAGAPLDRLYPLYWEGDVGRTVEAATRRWERHL